MQNVLVNLEVDVEDIVCILLGPYAVSSVPLLSPVAPVGHEVSPCHRLDWQMLAEVRRVFTYEDYLITRMSRFDPIFVQ